MLALPPGALEKRFGPQRAAFITAAMHGCSDEPVTVRLGAEWLERLLGLRVQQRLPCALEGVIITQCVQKRGLHINVQWHSPATTPAGGAGGSKGSHALWKLRAPWHRAVFVWPISSERLREDSPVGCMR